MIAETSSATSRSRPRRAASGGRLERVPGPAEHRTNAGSRSRCLIPGHRFVRGGLRQKRHPPSAEAPHLDSQPSITRAECPASMEVFALTAEKGGPNSTGRDYQQATEMNEAARRCNPAVPPPDIAKRQFKYRIPPGVPPGEHHFQQVDNPGSYGERRGTADHRGREMDEANQVDGSPVITGYRTFDCPSHRVGLKKGMVGEAFLGKLRLA
ncbi:hypothetical protein ABH973_000798 [Bradyrhizobium ottawaense]